MKIPLSLQFDWNQHTRASVLPRAAFVLQLCGSEAETEGVRPAKPKVSAVWFLLEKSANPCF